MRATSDPMAPVVAALVEKLGERVCVCGPRLAEIVVHWDQSGTGPRNVPLALLRPENTEQVSQALAICHAFNQSVVVQGGLTGLTGGASPLGGEVALSLVRLAGVEEIDASSGCMTVRAGTILQAAQEAAHDAGFLLPVDFGARGSCQIGGTIATNAGGMRVIAHGTMRQNVLGLEVVLMDGTVLSHLSKAVKDNTGYSLTQLFIGSEGTLGVVTRAVLKLQPLPPVQDTALCSLPDFGAAVALLNLARSKISIGAFEVMWPDHFLYCGGRGLFAEEPKMVVLIEGRADQLTSLLEGAFNDGIVTDALIAGSLLEADQFWEIRHMDHPESPLENEICLDVSLPLSGMDDFVRQCKDQLAALHPEIKSYFFGHMGDGNLHIVITAPIADPALSSDVNRVTYELVQAVAGSISAEHGIGLLKREWLGYSRSQAEISVMRSIKTALDPKGLLNPGKVI